MGVLSIKERACMWCGSVIRTVSPTIRICGVCRAARRCKECLSAIPLEKPIKARFCSQRCARKWSARNNPKVKAGLVIGRKWPTRKNGPAISKALKGRSFPERRGAKNPKWKGSMSPKAVRNREISRIEYKLWRFSVFKRDGFKCVVCGSKEYLEANHIKLWAEFLELRYSVNNGITLCRKHHQAIRGNESSWERRFDDFVRFASPIELSAEEKEKLLPVVNECSECGSEIVQNRSRGTRSHMGLRFCNKSCYKLFGAKFGYDWRNYSKGRYVA